MSNVRTRYAPSPTGYLHLGGAWTAFFNWLFTRHHDGVFVLRVEDTDRSRSTQQYEAAIFEDFRWLGIAWDEGPDVGGPFGPYRQTERTPLYAHYARELVERGAAYPCYCTREELDAERQRAVVAGQPYRYSGRCRSLAAAQRAALEAAGRRPALRLRVTDAPEPIVAHDLIRGDVVFDPRDLDDYIIVRSDGTALYNFANVVDDHLMQITHVIRGSEHLSNTPKQLVIYRALGWSPPAVAHLPTILGKDRRKLSKRHGDTAVRDYRAQGYLPEAILNFFALMAWHPEAEREVYTLEELIRLFRIEEIGKASPVFDLEKLTWLNGVYMRRLLEEDPDRVVDLCADILQRKGLLDAAAVSERRDYLRRVVAVVGERLKVGQDIIAYGDFFFRDVVYEPAAMDRYLTAAAAPLLRAYADALEALPAFERGAIEAALRDVCARAGVDARALVHPARVALTGKTAGPGLFELTEVLGRARAVARLRQAAAMAVQHAAP
ncbi:MAG: glutamate--tRNA ligase [Armatimonadota bacterium]|nr:glutamate--tRNA ligase [Armatimonadota bacterium]MDR7533296.1 glutamate--tRNA ligase [Armatimonadota bacterium]MDR7536585.1 glutamate--tRNA ligase [Armatimonadota bacterium]